MVFSKVFQSIVSISMVIFSTDFYGFMYPIPNGNDLFCGTDNVSEILMVSPEHFGEAVTIQFTSHSLVFLSQHNTWFFL